MQKLRASISHILFKNHISAATHMISVGFDCICAILKTAKHGLSIFFERLWDGMHSFFSHMIHSRLWFSLLVATIFELGAAFIHGVGGLTDILEGQGVTERLNIFFDTLYVTGDYGAFIVVILVSYTLLWLYEMLLTPFFPCNEIPLSYDQYVGAYSTVQNDLSAEHKVALGAAHHSIVRSKVQHSFFEKHPFWAGCGLCILVLLDSCIITYIHVIDPYLEEGALLWDEWLLNGTTASLLILSLIGSAMLKVSIKQQIQNDYIINADWYQKREAQRIQKESDRQNRKHALSLENTRTDNELKKQKMASLYQIRHMQAETHQSTIYTQNEISKLVAQANVTERQTHAAMRHEQKMKKLDIRKERIQSKAYTTLARGSHYDYQAQKLQEIAELSTYHSNLKNNVSVYPRSCAVPQDSSSSPDQNEELRIYFDPETGTAKIHNRHTHEENL